MRRFSLVFAVMASGLLACGDDAGGGSGGGGEELEQGFVECGSETCQPGTHCLDGVCLPGCASSSNCEEGLTCDVDDVTKDGTCVDGDGDGEGGSDGGEGGGDSGEGGGDGGEHTSDCDGYADYAQECGLAASFAEAIRQSCENASEQEKQAMIACAASESCDELRACSGAECFSDADCESGDCIDPNEAAGGQSFICG